MLVVIFLTSTPCCRSNDLQIRHPDSGKPAYRWLCWRGEPKNEADNSDINQSKKRVFGTDVTNYNFKRKRGVTTLDFKSNQGTSGQTNTKLAEVEQEFDVEEVKQHPKHASKGIVFGPFAPMSTSTLVEAANKRVRQVQDWESLASTYRPQYRNQGTF